MASIRILSNSVAAVLIAACSLSVSAQAEEETVEVEEIVKETPTETVEGFNALKYVLQKPNRNQFFRHKLFGDHCFVSVEGGAGWFMDPDNLFLRPQTDYKLGVSFGDWVTPVHGWRLSANAGRHHLDGHYSAFAGVSFDYLANFSALVRGYNHKRKFEVFGAAGVEYQRDRHCGLNHNIYGLRIGLQGRWNFARNLYAYIEPRLGAYFGPGIYKDIEDPSPFHYRIEPSLMVGLGFRRMTAEERALWTEPFVSRNAAENMFYEIGAGWTNLKKHNGKSGLFTDNNLTFSFSMGKWFSPYAGLRANASYGKIYNPHEFFMGGLDFMWNFTSVMNGYRVYSPIELDLFVGGCGIYVQNIKGKLYPGVEGGVKAMVNINPNWGIFVEPQVRWFGNGFRSEVLDTRLLTSLNLGLRYTIGDYKYDYDESLSEFRDSESKQFAIATVGPAKYKGSYGLGYALELGYGRWFSPMSAWKVGIDAQIFPHDIDTKLRNISFGGDYILSISSALAGYNPDRFFDFSGSLGGYVGVAYRVPYFESESSTGFIASLKASFIGSFRVAENWSVNVQTQSIAGLMPVHYGLHQFKPEMRLMLGAKYEF